MYSKTCIYKQEIFGQPPFPLTHILIVRAGIIWLVIFNSYRNGCQRFNFRQYRPQLQTEMGAPTY